MQSKLKSTNFYIILNFKNNRFLAMNKLKQEYQTKEDSKNNKTTNNQINLSVEKQLSKIYKQKDNCMLCISCQQDIMRQNIYNHIFEPLHILKLQEYFIQQSSNAQNKREKIQKKLIVKLSLFRLNISKRINREGRQKHQTIEIPQIDQELNQNINRNQIERFVEILQYDLKCIGKIQLSLIVSILVKTYCTINEIIEMKFSQILDKCTFYYININNSWEKSYLILKQRFPEYLQDFMSRNLGSNKHLIKLLGQNKRQTLSKELWLSCNKIQSQTTDAEYISFCRVQLQKLKKISLEKMAKRIRFKFKMNRLQRRQPKRIKLNQKSRFLEDRIDKNPEKVGNKNNNQIKIH